MSSTGVRISGLDSKKNQGATTATTLVSQSNSGGHRVNINQLHHHNHLTSVAFSPPSNSGRVQTKFQIAAETLRNCAATP